MSDRKKEDEAAQFLLKIAEMNGIVASTVSNGHVLIFKRSYLQDLLNKHPDKEMLSIFIERPDFTKTN